jgi:uncharacterized DUF497 family protein
VDEAVPDAAGRGEAGIGERSPVIACDKRKAFAQGSAATKHSISSVARRVRNDRTKTLTRHRCNVIFVVTGEDAAVRWTWDPNKAAANRLKHGVSFEVAALAFDDPFHASRADTHPDGERWHTMGLVGAVLLLVVHTWPEAESEGAELVGRIISARKATSRERKIYEEGNF